MSFWFFSFEIPIRRCQYLKCVVLNLHSLTQLKRTHLYVFLTVFSVSFDLSIEYFRRSRLEFDTGRNLQTRMAFIVFMALDVGLFEDITCMESIESLCDRVEGEVLRRGRRKA